MSGNAPPDDPSPDAAFPVVGDYIVVPGPGDPDYVELDFEDLDPPNDDDPEEFELDDVVDAVEGDTGEDAADTAFDDDEIEDEVEDDDDT